MQATHQRCERNEQLACHGQMYDHRSHRLEMEINQLSHQLYGAPVHHVLQRRYVVAVWGEDGTAEIRSEKRGESQYPT